MQEHMGSPAFKLVARNSRNNSPFFRSDTNNNNAPRPKTPPMSGNPKQERDREGERRAAALNLEWLKSSFKLLESALRERNKQLEIQKKEIEFLRNELRRKDDVIKEYENLINEREDMERQEVEILHKEIRTLRMDVMSKVVTIREHESEIERLDSKVEKLMSVMPPPSLPRARAQGVSAEPKNLNVNFQKFLKHYPKSER
ncbi:hypothetical protein OS493_017792 [Desmophyllum pertusum]|uniref:Uncharacterized protein n=1 Tax=Desmophyllum pertusum TaxID=174260 RepID=A0A9W9ZE28_9CNID|nr:hypothetical protein OS493_017792 [Desmophyllum pertusum]